jgi:hypothetical protein
VGEWRYSSTILYLGTRWRSVVSFTARPLYLHGRSRRYPLDRRLGGPQSRSGRCGIEKTLFPLPGIEARPSSPSLYRLSYLGSFRVCVPMISPFVHMSRHVNSMVRHHTLESSFRMCVRLQNDLPPSGFPHRNLEYNISRVRSLCCISSLIKLNVPVVLRV